MSTDVSRVYQFLAKQGDWKAIADENGDGTVIKSEFRTFMENNFEWNGEDASAQNDLINNFWKTIDTKQSGSLKGTNLKNKNALDSNELATMDKKIAYYEVLNDFTADLSAPSVVSDSANWKKSVSDGLAALVEKYNGSEEDLLAYLEEQSPVIEAKTTADYCANEYLKSEMETLVKEYGYAYADDSTLQGMIDSYIQGLAKGVTAASGEEGEETTVNPLDPAAIQATVINIIDAYLATAGLNDDANFGVEDLAQYGYSPTNTSNLNDLQKSILTKTLETDLAGSDLKEDYENNTELFKTAMESYISGLKYGDFATVSADVLGSFKSSDAYKSVEKNIQVQELLVGDEFKNALTTNISESIANTIINDGKYLTVMKEIKTDVLEKAQNGEFDNNDGALDTSAVITYLIEQVSSRLAEFYPNGFGDMSLDELNVMYDKLVESADKQEGEEKQLEARRDAAIEYCKALSEKSTKFAEIVKDAFGESYATEISKMLPSEIDGIIAELKAEATELGDANELTMVDSGWNIDSEIKVCMGMPSTFNITPAFTTKDGVSKTITTDRITYKSSNTDLIDVDTSGKITVKGTSKGTFSAKISIMVDGVEVGEKTITVNCAQEIDYNKVNADFNGKPLSQHFVSGKTALCLSGFTSWENARNNARGNIINYINQLADILKSAGYNAEIVQKAATTTINYYSACFDAIYDHGTDSNYENYNSIQFAYVDANGNTCNENSRISQKTKKYERDAGRTGVGAENIDHNSTGIRMNESYNNNNTYEYYINVGVLLEKFQYFYSIM